MILLDRRARGQDRRDAIPAVRVLLADGEKLVRAGLRELLEKEGDIAVAGEAASGRKALVLAREMRPDVVLVGARLSGADGLEATRWIATDPELSQIPVLTMIDEERDEHLFGALRAGASGLLTQNAQPAELVSAVRLLARGGAHLSASLTRRLIDEFASQPDPQSRVPQLFEELTDREREITALVASGLSNQEIAEQLVVSPVTVKTHVNRAMVKLQVHDRAKLVALAYQAGFAQQSHGRGSSCLGRVHPHA